MAAQGDLKQKTVQLQVTFEKCIMNNCSIVSAWLSLDIERLSGHEYQMDRNLHWKEHVSAITNMTSHGNFEISRGYNLRVHGCFISVEWTS